MAKLRRWMWVLGVTSIVFGFVARGMFHTLLPMRGRIEMADLAFIEATTYGFGMFFVLAAMTDPRWRRHQRRAAVGCAFWALTAIVLSVLVLDSLPP
jgi:hypothetical protein